MNSKIKGLIKALFARYPNAWLNGPFIITDVTSALAPMPQDYHATSSIVASTLEAMRKKGIVHHIPGSGYTRKKVFILRALNIVMGNILQVEVKSRRNLREKIREAFLGTSWKVKFSGSNLVYLTRGKERLHCFVQERTC
jgi:hypothetical protein